MKKILLLLNVLLFFQLSAQKNLASKKWQNDLRFFQNTIHKDYSHLFVKTTKTIFDKEVETFYKEIPNLKSHEIVVGFSKLISLLNKIEPQKIFLLFQVYYHNFLMLFLLYYYHKYNFLNLML